MDKILLTFKHTKYVPFIEYDLWNSYPSYLEVRVIDSTHVKASANKHKFDKKIVRKETKAYNARLQEEVNKNREDHGKNISSR